MIKIQHLDLLNIIQLNFDIWSGKTSLSASDLKLGKGGEIPPEHLIRLGTKKICNPDTLNRFLRLRTQAKRLCRHYGIPFLSGFAIPVSKADEVCQRLNEISLAFQQAKLQFIHSYDADIEAWIQENPPYENAIRMSLMSCDTAAKRINFDYRLFMIQPPEHSQESAQRLKTDVEGLGDQLIEEIIEKANKLYTKKLAGKYQCNVRTKKVLQNLRDKLNGLYFLNSAFSPLVKMLDETLRDYDHYAEGNQIVAPFFYQVMAVVLIMCERSKIEQYANGLITPQAVVTDIKAGLNNAKPSALIEAVVDEIFKPIEVPTAVVERSTSLLVDKFAQYCLF